VGRVEAAVTAEGFGGRLGDWKFRVGGKCGSGSLGSGIRGMVRRVGERDVGDEVPFGTSVEETEPMYCETL
jgi:hypothetical protein